MRVTIRYDEVKRKAVRYGKCPTCGERTRRSNTFVETVSPFNRHKDTGEVKTYEEVVASVEARAAAWNPDPRIFEHWNCEDERMAECPNRANTAG